jgi:splicing factor U2AF subunit
VDDSEHFEEFYEEIMEEFAKFGELEHLHVVENLGDHMFGNVYVKFASEEHAEACLKAMSGRYYAGRLVAPEYSPVSDFSEARCRQFDEDHCLRGGYCNFMHLKHIPRFLRKILRETRKKKKKRSRSRSKSRSRRRRSSRSRSGSRSRRRRRSSRSKSPGAKKDDLSRSDSAERRAKIASWRKAKEEPVAEVAGEKGTAEAGGEAAAPAAPAAPAAEATPVVDAAPAADPPAAAQ